MPLIVEAELRRTPVILFRRGVNGQSEYRLAVLKEMNSNQYNAHLTHCYLIEEYAKEVSTPAKEGEADSQGRVVLKPKDPTNTLSDEVSRCLWVESNPTPSDIVRQMVDEGKADVDKGDARLLSYFDTYTSDPTQGRGERAITLEELESYPANTVVVLHNVLKGWEKEQGDATRP